MNLEKERIRTILNQSDEELLPKVQAVLCALEIPQEMQEKLLCDLPELRRKAEEIRDADLYKARMFLGDEELSRLIGILEQKNG